MERRVTVDPFHSPLSLLSNDRDIDNGIEEESLLILILNVGINQKRVGLRMNIFHGNLKSIEASGLWDLNLGAELLSEVLEHDPIRGGKKC